MFFVVNLPSHWVFALENSAPNNTGRPCPKSIKSNKNCFVKSDSPSFEPYKELASYRPLKLFGSIAIMKSLQNMGISLQKRLQKQVESVERRLYDWAQLCTASAYEALFSTTVSYPPVCTALFGCCNLGWICFYFYIKYNSYLFITRSSFFIARTWCSPNSCWICQERELHQTYKKAGYDRNPFETFQHKFRTCIKNFDNETKKDLIEAETLRPIQEPA